MLLQSDLMTLVRLNPRSQSALLAGKDSSRSTSCMKAGATINKLACCSIMCISSWKGSQPLIPKLASRVTHVGSSRLIQTPKIVCKVISLLICTNPALRDQRIHPIVLYSSFTMEPSSRYKRLLSISVGNCPTTLHRSNQDTLCALASYHMINERSRRGHCPISHKIHCPLSTHSRL